MTLLSNLYGSTGNYGLFEADTNGDWMPVEGTREDPSFELDGNSDLMPIVPTLGFNPQDTYFELDGNLDIMPKT